MKKNVFIRKRKQCYYTQHDAFSFLTDKNNGVMHVEWISLNEGRDKE